MIEEGLEGEECSLLVLCDGTRAVPLVPAQDFKRIGDGDVGPNTGGMGAYAPMPQVSAGAVDRLMDAAVLPLVEELRRRGIDYRGVLYAGLMLTSDGPKVIEYNVRFGDPEAQVVLPLLASDAAALFLAVADGDLARSAPPRFSGDAAVCVVLASQGYPEHPRTGDTIEGLDTLGQSVTAVDGVTVFHAGTGRHSPDGPFHTAGGRVLGVTATAPTLAEACERAYAAAAPIDWEGMQMRHDIAARVLGPRVPGAGGRRVIPRTPPRTWPRSSATPPVFRSGSRSSSWPPRPRAPSVSCPRTRPPPAGPRLRPSTTCSSPRCSSARR